MQPASPQLNGRALSLLWGDVALVSAIGALGVGFLAPQASTMIQMALSAIFILLADIRLLPALLILEITPTDFKGGVGASMDIQYERFEGMVIWIAGLPLTANYILLFALAVRVLAGFVLRPSILRGPVGWISLVLWFVSLSFALTNSLMSRQLGNPSWSAPMRISLTIAALWYGQFISTAKQDVVEVLRRRIAPLLAVMLGFMFFEALSSRLNWLALSLGITLALDAWSPRDQSGNRAMLGGILASLAIAVSLGIRATPELMELARDRAGSFSSTLTTLLVPLLTGVASLVSWSRFKSQKLLSRPTIRGVRPVAVLLWTGFCLFPFIIPPLTLGMAVEARGKGEGVSIRERMQFKLFLERAAIWRGAIDQISQPPFVIVPAGRPGYAITNSSDLIPFRSGAHNVILEALRTAGWLVGGIAIVFYGGAVVAACIALVMRAEVLAAMVAPVVIAIILATGSAGHALLDPILGFPTLLFAGICMNLNHVRSNVGPQDVTIKRAFAPLPR